MYIDWLPYHLQWRKPRLRHLNELTIQRKGKELIFSFYNSIFNKFSLFVCFLLIKWKGKVSEFHKSVWLFYIVLNKDLEPDLSMVL